MRCVLLTHSAATSQRRAPAPRQRCIFLKTNSHSGSGQPAHEHTSSGHRRWRTEKRGREAVHILPPPPFSVLLCATAARCLLAQHNPPLPPRNTSNREWAQTMKGGEWGEQQYAESRIHALLPPSPPACASPLSGAQAASPRLRLPSHLRIKTDDDSHARTTWFDVDDASKTAERHDILGSFGGRPALGLWRQAALEFATGTPGRRAAARGPWRGARPRLVRTNRTANCNGQTEAHRARTTKNWVTPAGQIE